MALPGTQLANKVLDQTGLRKYFSRHFTQRRIKDRSYKIWGRFSDQDATHIKQELTREGAVNARITYSGFAGRMYVSGVRFELQGGQ